MVSPQVLLPGRSGWNLVVAVAACLVALSAVWHGASFSPTAGRGLDPGVSSLSRPAAAAVAPPESAPVRAQAVPTSRRAGRSAAVAFGALPTTLSLTRFDAASSSANAAPLAPAQSLRAAHPTATPELEPGHRVVATVSFYYCSSGSGYGPAGDGGAWCGVMRDGTVVYSGAAACDYEYLGQRFRIEGDPTGRVYTCNDTGSKVHGLHRDIWFQTSDEGWRWQRDVGKRVVIEIVY